MAGAWMISNREEQQLGRRLHGILGGTQAIGGHGREVPLGTMPAFTDGTNWSEGGIPAIPAFGPGLLPLAHRPNEYVEVREVVQAARIYALTGLAFLSAAA